MAHKTSSPDEHDELLHILGGTNLIGLEILRRIETDDSRIPRPGSHDSLSRRSPNPRTNAQGDSTYESSHSPARRSTRRLAHGHGGCSSISRRGGFRFGRHAWDRTDTYLSMSSTGPLGWAGDMDGFICEMPEDENLPAAPMTAA
jgi:hypothetical protein